jgi:hypothetical protein
LERLAAHPVGASNARQQRRLERSY